MRFYMVMDSNGDYTGHSYLDRGVAVDHVKRYGGFDRYEIKECELNIEGSLLEYIFQEDVNNRLKPRLIDIGYTAFMNSFKPNKDDGGKSDWFNDTRPIIQNAIEMLKKDIFK